MDDKKKEQVQRKEEALRLKKETEEEEKRLQIEEAEEKKKRKTERLEKDYYESYLPYWAEQDGEEKMMEKTLEEYIAGRNKLEEDYKQWKKMINKWKSDFI